jgi:hypothetical protein
VVRRRDEVAASEVRSQPWGRGARGAEYSFVAVRGILLDCWSWSSHRRFLLVTVVAVLTAPPFSTALFFVAHSISGSARTAASLLNLLNSASERSSLMTRWETSRRSLTISPWLNSSSVRPLWREESVGRREEEETSAYVGPAE